MKINGYMFNEKKYIKRLFIIMFIIFGAGIVAGTLYSISLSPESDNSLFRYLSRYFKELTSSDKNAEILKNSVISYIKIFFIIFISSFVKAGIVPISSTVFIKGFISGFTCASSVKYYGFKGLLVPCAGFVSDIISIPVLLFLSAISAKRCFLRPVGKKELFAGYMLLSFCCFTIFCATSFLDAYLTTTFMKLVSHFFTS